MRAGGGVAEGIGGTTDECTWCDRWQRRQRWRRVAAAAVAPYERQGHANAAVLPPGCPLPDGVRGWVGRDRVAIGGGRGASPPPPCPTLPYDRRYRWPPTSSHDRPAVVPKSTGSAHLLGG